MKKIILTILLSCFILISFAQLECGTPSNFPDRLPTYGIENGSVNDESPICLRVFFHIVRNSAGTNGYSSSQIPSLLTRLNQAFNPHNILIINAGQDFINNDTYGLGFFDDSNFEGLISTQNNPNAINIYLLPSTYLQYAGRSAGIPSKSLVIDRDYIESSTSPHELGHCLNLFHTFHQLEISNNCANNTSNWTDCGECSDFVCDTPTDPGLSCGVNVDNFTCAYTGSNTYNPDTRNIMSSSCRFTCRNRFSAGQGARMRTSLRFDPILTPVVTTNCISVQGLSTLCLNASNTYSVINAPAGATFEWTLSNSGIIQIQGSNTNSSVTVSRLNDGVVTLRCNITIPTGTIFASKDIAVGKPTFMNATFTKNGQTLQLSIDWNQDGSGANTLCKGVQSVVKTNWPAASNVVWTGPNYSFPAYWNDAGFDNFAKISTMSLHIYNFPITGYWTVTGSNACGSTAYPISFKTQDCASTNPCTYYKISPNPIKNGEIIIIAKPAPMNALL
jgi:hypothetical protein